MVEMLLPILKVKFGAFSRLIFVSERSGRFESQLFYLGVSETFCVFLSLLSSVRGNY
jgi:hypothetical protein